jgi:two-component system response regulator AtoC
VSRTPKVYVLDDDRSFARLLAANLRATGAFQVEPFERAIDMLDRCAEEPPDAVVTDLVMPEVDGLEVTRRLRRRDPHLPIFVLTAHGEIESAIQALKTGANEYLNKPVNLDELTTLLRRALAERPMREEATSLEQVRRHEFSTGAVLGDDAKLAEVRQFVERVAATPNATVLLLGESGTGKNLVARAIHYSTDDAAGRFVEVNCSALPAQLLEPELFGYQKGAFTDARESKRGLIEVADGGTLFLDEIGELSPELQAKLLNFLESRRIRRVGGTDEIEVRLRIVAATNRDLELAVQQGRFRADLYYRVRVATLTLPPLRDMKDDIPLFANHFREVFNREFKKEVREIAPDALTVLRSWHWPGNVRELRNVIERAMIFADGSVLLASHLPTLAALEQPSSARAGDAFPIAKGLSLGVVEREYIRHTMDEVDGDVQRAAEILGISRKSLWERRKKHGLLD